MQCLNSGKYAQKVQQSYNDAIAAGGPGTPYILIMVRLTDAVPLQGAQPYDSMRAAIDAVIAQLPGGSTTVGSTTPTTPTTTTAPATTQ